MAAHAYVLETRKLTKNVKLEKREKFNSKRLPQSCRGIMELWRNKMVMTEEGYMGRVVGRDVSGKFDVKIAGLHEIRKISEDDLIEPLPLVQFSRVLVDFGAQGLTAELKRRKCVQQTPITKTSTSVSSSSVDSDDLLPDIGSSEDEQAARDNRKPSKHEHSEQVGENWRLGGVCRVINDEGIPTCIAYDSINTNFGLDASQQLAIKFGVGAAQASSSNAENVSLLVDDWEVLEVQQQKKEYSDNASSRGSHSSTRSSHRWQSILYSSEDDHKQDVQQDISFGPAVTPSLSAIGYTTPTSRALAQMKQTEADLRIRSENAENDLAVKHGVCAHSELIANEEEQRADDYQRLQLKQELAESRTRESDLKGSICELENELHRLRSRLNEELARKTSNRYRRRSP